MILLHSKTDFYRSSKIGLLAKSSVKIKRSELFAVNNDIKKLSFWKLIIERSFYENEIKLRIYDCTSTILDKTFVDFFTF